MCIMSLCKLKLIFCTALVGLIFHGCSSQLTPTVCTDGEYVVLGSVFSFRVNGEMSDRNASESNVEGNCTFWDWKSESSVSLQRGSTWTVQGSGYVFNSTGTYGYSCNNGDMGNLTVVPAQHTIPLCKGCIEINEIQLKIGDSLQWVVVPENIDASPPMCEVALNSSSGNQALPSTATDSSQHIFQETGTFVLYCKNDPAFNATIVVVAEDEVTTNDKYLPLLYTHAALMIVSFGILFPISVFLYCHHFNFILYLVLFILTWIMSLIGFLLVIIYIRLTTGHFFRRIVHAALGYPIMFEYIVGLSIFLVHKVLRPFHARLSHVVLLAAISGVISGLPILPAPFVPAIVVCALYGLILLIMTAIYTFYNPKEKSTTDDDVKKKSTTEIEFKKK